MIVRVSISNYSVIGEMKEVLFSVRIHFDEPRLYMELDGRERFNLEQYV